MSNVPIPLACVLRLASHVLSLALALMAPLAGLAEDSLSTNTWGMLTVDSGRTNTLVAVPWIACDELCDEGTNAISVAALVKTRNLVPGDALVAIGTNGVYNVWEVGAGRQWQTVTTVARRPALQEVITPVAAAEHPVDRGTALWLVRCGEGSDLGKPVYVAGQHSAAHGERTMVGGTPKSPALSLVSVPVPEGFDLNTIQEGVMETQGVTDALMGDEINLITDGAPRRYTFKGGKWGWDEDVTTTIEKKGRTISTTTKVRHETETLIPFGTGFWYASRGGTPTIKW